MAKKKSSLKIPGLSFSWKRATGITAAKRKWENLWHKIKDGPVAYATGDGAL